MKNTSISRRTILWIMLFVFLPVPLVFSQNCFAPPPQMISWWGAEGNANDSSGSNPGTLQGGVTFAAGKVGQAFSFNGVDGYVNVPDSASLNIKTAITIEAWVKPSNPTNGDSQIIGAQIGRYGLQIQPDGRVQFYLEINVSADNQLTTVHPLQANVFTHVVGTYDPATGLQKIYLNGVLDNSRTTSGTPKGSGGVLQIGAARGMRQALQFFTPSVASLTISAYTAER